MKIAKGYLPELGRILFYNNKAKPALCGSSEILTFKSQYEKTSLYPEYGLERNRYCCSSAANELLFDN